jgi:hypothetical protein
MEKSDLKINLEANRGFIYRINPDYIKKKKKKNYNKKDL